MLTSIKSFPSFFTSKGLRYFSSFISPKFSRSFSQNNSQTKSSEVQIELQGPGKIPKMFENGKEIPSNEVERRMKDAALEMKSGADLGLPEAQISYGSFLQNGLGVKQDLKEASRYYKMAADQGFAEGQYQ